MPVYEFKCSTCDLIFEVICTREERKQAQPCPECEGETERIMSAVGIVLKGDGWPSKAFRVNGQMAEKRGRLAQKERDLKGDGFVPKLAPNVGGERTETWEDAKRLAGEKGKDTSTYDKHIQEERVWKKHGPSSPT